jgi:transcriptional regulator with XRE-family HTH domain
MLIKFSAMDTHRKLTVEEGSNPGETIRTLRKRGGLTLSDLSSKTGLAVSTLSKVEKGQVSLSYDKLMLISRGLGVDMAQILDSAPHPGARGVGSGRRVLHRIGEGQLVETRSYKHLYLATEMLSKRLIPMIGEVKARTVQEFFEEFGDYIRHPGEEFVYVLEGEIEFHTEFYAPVRLKAGESMYFDSEMGHAYLKASEETCRGIVVCSGRGDEAEMFKKFVSASMRLANTEPERPAAAPRAARGKGRVAK